MTIEMREIIIIQDGERETNYICLNEWRGNDIVIAMCWMLIMKEALIHVLYIMMKMMMMPYDGLLS